eukprot:CAMPEP_0176114698 /NCGR_PEP_ID=MMETSP0120_2-20121206/57600_1 /TAXON_ID=160619 /ORGANISM="Kryptoperidinium foliaceum, Strain CCMP 1326" /LENGTH=101 /DNA_ID=CAMNT_0017448933 /DNA_START=25 /DNA_END=327 /DNA_ORIENTATION=-
MKLHKEALFTMVSSKADSAQIALNSFFNPKLTEASWYWAANFQLQAFGWYPNFRVYLLDGDVRKQLSTESFYTAKQPGTHPEDQVPTLLEWTTAIAKCDWP